MTLLPFRRSKSAFTLVEILLTIAIIAILAAFLFVNLRPKERLEQASAAKIDVEMRELKNAFKQHSLTNDGRIIDTLSDKFEPICKYGTWREYRRILKELAEMSDAPEPPEPPTCIDADALVDEGVIADIPVIETYETEEDSGFLARADCVNNIFVSYPGEQQQGSNVDVNGDGKIDLNDYRWENRNRDFDDDGDIDFDDHLLFANQFRDYCDPPCPCSESQKIDIVFAIDTSNSFSDEWLAMSANLGNILSQMTQIGYDINSKIYAMELTQGSPLVTEPDCVSELETSRSEYSSCRWRYDWCWNQQTSCRNTAWADCMTGTEMWECTQADDPDRYAQCISTYQSCLADFQDYEDCRNAPHRHTPGGTAYASHWSCWANSPDYRRNGGSLCNTRVDQCRRSINNYRCWNLYTGCQACVADYDGLGNPSPVCACNTAAYDCRVSYGVTSIASCNTDWNEAQSDFEECIQEKMETLDAEGSSIQIIDIKTVTCDLRDRLISNPFIADDDLTLFNTVNNLCNRSDKFNENPYFDASEAWGPTGYWIINDFSWRDDATKILFIIGDQFPSGGGTDFNDYDVYLSEELQQKALSEGIFLFGMSGQWESTSTTAYGDTDQIDIEEIMAHAIEPACGNVISYNTESDALVGAAASFMVNSCLINCDCQIKNN